MASKELKYAVVMLGWDLSKSFLACFKQEDKIHSFQLCVWQSNQLWSRTVALENTGQASCCGVWLYCSKLKMA